MKIIAIAGGSGSGKTTLANYIKELNPQNSLLISLDDYYFDKEQQMELNGFCNYDHPLALEKELLLQNLEDLQRDGEVDIPKYCFKKRHRIEYQKVKILKNIIIEGLYALDFLKDIKAMKIYVEADSDLLLSRRIKRDIQQRDRELDDILDQYIKSVKPAYDNFIINQKELADIVINNNFQSIDNFIYSVKNLIV
jgi:uridine kinase